MGETSRVTQILIQHFFRRFFDNDTIQVEGDTLTTVVRALAIVTVPGMMIAFFLQNHYPKTPWGAIEDQYFFVLFSFVVMGAVSIFEWEMLFPDRLDFLVLSPLSVKPLQMLAAKSVALVGFLTLFLIACNLFGIVMLPAVSKGDFLRQIYAHAAAVLLAGTFAALLILAIGGVLLCVLSAAWFRVASPMMQMLSVMAVALLMLEYARYADSMQALLSEPLGMARWMPPVWFLGVYQQFLYGDAAPAFAREAAHSAIRGTEIAGLVVLLTYPMAWARMRKMAVEGSSRKRSQPSAWFARLIHAVVRRPAERAVFHFIGQTIARNNRYQVYLAIYGGTGLALAVACAVTFREDVATMHPSLSNYGLHAMTPLLLFWVIAGLRMAFAFPLSLSAGWVFRISGANTGESASAARRWVLYCALSVSICIVAGLRLAGWDIRHLFVQIMCGLCLSIFLTDVFFFSQQSVPFNQPRMPGKANFPLMLTLYVGVFPLFILWVVHVEMQMENNLTKLLLPTLGALGIHASLRVLRRRSDEVEEEMEGYEGEFQLLGLS